MDADRIARRLRAAELGHVGSASEVRPLLDDEDAETRCIALQSLARLHSLDDSDLERALADESGRVRRRACQLAAAHPSVTLVELLSDSDARVAEVAAWALGEQLDRTAIAALAEMATDHSDPLCREAAVAALGAIGDERGLAAILKGTQDKAAIRRRAVLALAPFEGPEVDAALALALEDRDWQVRQAAEDLLSPD